MNTCRALTLLHRSVQWTNCQTFVRTSCDPKCQAVMKVLHVNISSLTTKNPTLHKVHQSQPPAILSVQRNYASKKSVKKKTNVQVNLTGLGELIEVDDMIQKMEGAVQTMKTEFVKSLSLRSAGSIESIKVKFEGKEYELQQVAKMTRKGQQIIVLDMLSFPQMTKTVVDTLKTSALNLNPQQEGTTIFVPIPKVTKEHREILAKKAKALFITCRDAIKQIQERNIKELRNSDISDSEKQSAYKQVKSIADKYVTQSEEIMKGKQDELLGKS